MDLKTFQKKNIILHHKEGAMVALALFGFWAFGIGSIYGFSIFPDEFAYWAYGAGAAGYDWSDITSLGPYYSYGYSVFLIPVFALCRDAVTAYRMAVSMNFLFLFFAYAVLAGTMRKLVPDPKIPVALFSAFVILAPYNLFYTQMTMTEVLLVSLYVAAGGLLFCYLENNRLSALLILLLTLMYSYIVHMRTVGILLSCVIVLAFHIFMRKEKRWHFLVMAGVLLLLFAAADAGKRLAFASIYGGKNLELVAGNDYSGQIEKIRYIFTGEGFYDLAVSILGKFLYLGLATYGLFYWGIFALAAQAIKLLQSIGKPAERTASQEFSLFVLLSVVSQVLIATIYLLTLGEAGDYTYGRYNELVTPFVMALGLGALWKQKAGRIWRTTVVLGIMQMGIAWLVAHQIERTGAGNFYGYFLVGISYLYEEGSFMAGRFYAAAWAFCEALTVLVTAAALFCRSGRKRQYVIIFLVVLEAALAMRAEGLYLEPFKKAAFRDSRMADKISALQEAGGGRVIYMDCQFPAYIGMLQFMARDLDIQVMGRRGAVSDYGEEVTGRDLLVFAFDDGFIQEWKDRYGQEDTYGHFTLLYNDHGGT